MTSSAPEPFDVVVVGAGPAGVVAALRAARLGARTALVTRDQFGGMAANDGPVPVRTFAQAARLIREARQLPRYGIAGSEPSLDYPRLLARVREVTAAAREQTLLRDDLDRAGVRIYEQVGPARFADAHTVESDNAPRLHADKVIICTGGISRPLPVPGFELTATHSDAWNLSSVPPSLLVIGAGATTACHRPTTIPENYPPRQARGFRAPHPTGLRDARTGTSCTGTSGPVLLRRILRRCAAEHHPPVRRAAKASGSSNFRANPARKDGPAPGF